VKSCGTGLISPFAIVIVTNQVTNLLWQCKPGPACWRLIGILRPLANPETLKNRSMCNFGKTCLWERTLFRLEKQKTQIPGLQGARALGDLNMHLVYVSKLF